MGSHQRVLQALGVVATVAVLTTCRGTDGTGPGADTPSAIAPVSGNGQAGVAGETLAQPLVVRVTTATGTGAAGVTVTWAVTIGGGTLSATSTSTDSAGETRVTWTLGAVVGANGAQATVTGVAGSPVSFQAVCAAGLPTQLAFVSGDSQVGTVARALPDSLVVVARDHLDNPVPGVAVTWAVSASGRIASTTSGRTDSKGCSSVAWTLGPRIGSQIVTANLPSTTAVSVTFTATALADSAAGLAFTVQPNNVIVGAAIVPAVEVTVVDSFGNTVLAAATRVSITLGANPANATLSGTMQVGALNGVADFSALSIDKAAVGYTLSATAPGVATATSMSFNVLPPPAATRLTFAVQPTSAAAGTAIAPAIQVTARDAQGRVSASYNGSITVLLATNPGGGTLSGTTAISATAGVAVFTDLKIDKAAPGYTLRATASGLTPDTSATFDITPGAASRLVFTTQPAPTASGEPINEPGNGVRVTAQDLLGNTVTGFTGQVKVALFDTPPTGSGPLTGTTSVSASGGVATFSNLSLTKAASGYTLIATATGLVNDISAPFAIVPGPLSRLAFTVQPGNTLVGVAIAPPVEVTAQDAHGNTVTGFAGTVTVAITPGRGANGASLTGSTAVTASAGAATFPDLRIDKPARGYTLRAASTGLADTSAAFDITASAYLTAIVGDRQIGLSGFALNVAPAVQVRDAANAPVPNLPVTFAVAGGGGTVSGAAAVTDVNGVAAVAAWIVGTGANALTATVQSTGVAGNPATFTATGVTASYDIEVQYLTNVIPAVQQAVDSAKSRWQRLIYLDVPDVGANIPAGTCGAGTPAFNAPIDDIVIFVQLDSIDGPGSVVAQSGPCVVRGTGRLPALGVLKLDSADVGAAFAAGELDDLVLHEMGHVLGYATIWPDLGLLADAGGTDPHFTGPKAIAAFDEAGGASYGTGKVPVENCAGLTPDDCPAGVRDRHWRESVLGTELMSGRLDPGVPHPLSVITAASMADLGYTVNFAAADPFALPKPLPVRSAAFPIRVAQDLLPIRPLVITSTSNR